MACGPGHPELSKSYMDMASKLFTYTFTFTTSNGCCSSFKDHPRGLRARMGHGTLRSAAKVWVSYCYVAWRMHESGWHAEDEHHKTVNIRSALLLAAVLCCSRVDRSLGSWVLLT